MPDKYRAFQDTWVRNHPDFKIERWNKERMLAVFPELGEVFERCNDERQLSDIGRCFILLKYGGLYVDCDFECYKSLEPLMHESFVGSEDGRYISNGLIYCYRPNNKAMGKVCREIVNFEQGVGASKATGPIRLTNILRDLPFGIKVYPPEYFYPVHWSGSYSELASAHELGAYACHHWKKMEQA